MKYPSLKEALYIIGTLITLGGAWGSLSTRVSALETASQDIAPTSKQLAVLTQKVADLDDTLKDFIRRSQPLGQEEHHQSRY